MWTVVGGRDRSTITRPCRDREEAEQWARQLLKAGITPVKIDGVQFEPERSGTSEPAPGVP